MKYTSALTQLYADTTLRYYYMEAALLQTPDNPLSGVLELARRAAKKPVSAQARRAIASLFLITPEEHHGKITAVMRSVNRTINAIDLKKWRAEFETGLNVPKDPLQSFCHDPL